MNDEKPKKKQREANLTTRIIARGIIALLLLACVIVVILAILQPAIGNIFSNVMNGDTF